MFRFLILRYTQKMVLKLEINFESFKKSYFMYSVNFHVTKPFDKIKISNVF